MGYPMAGHLARAGGRVTVYNRTVARAEAWLSEHPGGREAATPAEGARGAALVFVCSGNADGRRAGVVGGGGAVGGGGG